MIKLSSMHDRAATKAAPDGDEAASGGAQAVLDG